MDGLNEQQMELTWISPRLGPSVAARLFHSTRTSMTPVQKAELIIQDLLAAWFRVDSSEIKLQHIQYFCRNADKRDILRYRGIGPVSYAALRGTKPPEVSPDDPIIERIDRMLEERPTPEATRIYSTAYFALRRRVAELRGVAEDGVTNEEVVAYMKSMSDRELVRIEGVGSRVEDVREEIENWPNTRKRRRRSW
jgi:hypothetical protein